MILPDKIVKVNDSMLYNALEYYRNSKVISVNSKQDILFLTILYAIRYIEYEKVSNINFENGEVDYEIRISKIK